ncbi:MAG: iron-containing alcohol dehydrogenase [Gudongella sp.]|nr:iron-containing alcohol dehydrogenase [Gudongella sp.]
MYKLYCRLYQMILRGVSGFLPWRMPELLQGRGSIRRLPVFIKEKGIENLLIITDKGIRSIGLMDELLLNLEHVGMDYKVYDKTVANPTIDNIEEALSLYKANDCQGILAFGGGSPMDCAKGVAARLARPNKTIPQMRGLLKIRRTTPPLIAVPTTSGTGSEGTLAAVITNSSTHEKYAINDISLIPHYAVLDPALTIGLPQHITATTGMDALTHAVEAYIGRSNTHETREWSKEAVRLVFENIFEAYENGDNIEARENMQKAAYYAGLSFTRAYVGYVHAVAHTLGGFYGMPHGLANAVILPYVLEYFGECVHRPLAELADVAGVSQGLKSDREKAERFISEIRRLSKQMDIPEKLQGIEEKDIPVMVERAFHESNPLYPVPRFFDKDDLGNIYKLIRA